MNNIVLVHALHKSATMFLFQLFKKFSEDNDFLFYSPNLNPPNYDNFGDDISRSPGRNFCYCPRRSFKTGVENQFIDTHKIFRIVQIRDPRDILCSEYFSLAYIHPDKGWNSSMKSLRETVKTMDINEFALLSSCKNGYSLFPISLKDRLSTFEQFAQLDNILIVKYEDMILDREFYFNKIGSFLAECVKGDSMEMFNHYNKLFSQKLTPPAQENMTHKRKMIPGDHKEKLSDATIKKLNEVFGPFLQRNNYL